MNTARARAARGRTRTTVLGLAVLAAGTALTLAGCANAASPSSASASSAHKAAEGLPAAVPARAGGSGTAASGTGASGPAAASLTLATQSIIYTASLTVQAAGGNVAAAVARATGIVTAVGGYTASERETVARGHKALSSAQLRLKIPVASYPATLAKLSNTLGRQTSLNRQAQDVTQEVADVGSRVTSAQDAIAQLRALLRRAGSVSSLLRVQDQINSEESSLEALLAQQRALARQTSYATVSLALVRHPVPPVHKKRHQNGFLAGLTSGWRGLRATVTWLLTVFGAILPFLVVIAILAAGGYLGWRRHQRRRTRPAPAGSAGPAS